MFVMMKGPMAKAIRKMVNADFPGCFKFLTGYVAILIGAILTVLVQSSSVFTSTLTPSHTQSKYYSGQDQE
jgi:sodium-dependent phosphate cotransporter